jgi:hypothetical protein
MVGRGSRSRGYNAKYWREIILNGSLNGDVNLDRGDALLSQGRAGDRNLEPVGSMRAGIREIAKRRPLQRQPAELRLIGNGDIIDHDRRPTQTLNTFGAGIDLHGPVNRVGLQSKRFWMQQAISACLGLSWRPHQDKSQQDSQQSFSRRKHCLWHILKAGP